MCNSFGSDNICIYHGEGGIDAQSGLSLSHYSDSICSCKPDDCEGGEIDKLQKHYDTRRCGGCFICLQHIRWGD